MTPEVAAENAVEGCRIVAAGFACQTCITRTIRAAIAERDAQWGEAVKDQLLDCEACGHMFDIPGSRFASDGEPGACAKCDPLRSLLDPAGKGRTE